MSLPGRKYIYKTTTNNGMRSHYAGSLGPIILINFLISLFSRLLYHSVNSTKFQEANDLRIKRFTTNIAILYGETMHIFVCFSFVNFCGM